MIKRLGRIGLGLALGLSLPSALIAPARIASGAEVPEKFHRFRSFRIPFNIAPADRDRFSEVLLYVSSNQGHDWDARGKTPPDQPFFTFTAPRDGEFWFAVRSKDLKGRIFPDDKAEIKPDLKVIIDTLSPVVTLSPRPRRGGRASVHWEIVEENFDPTAVRLEYQADGARNWSRVPIKPLRIDTVEWEAGTAEPLRVRLTAVDRAGNSKTAVVDLPEGVASRPTANTFDPQEEMAPPLGTLTAREVEESRLPDLGSATSPPASGAGTDLGAQVPGNTNSRGFDPFRPAGPPTEPPATGAGPGTPLLVASPRFNLQYEVDDAGPSGRPASVELWVTQDGGQTWFRRGVDPDQTSPFPVDLGGEGSFGLKLVARSLSNLGDLPPAPGEPPQTLVEVDSSPPAIKLDPVKVGNEAHSGKVAITWHASDPHLGGRPVAISVRPDAPNTAWQAIGPAMENTGQFVWTVPANFPNRFHVRVDVMDTLGNRGYADTTETGPVLVDRTRPRGRIIGLDPSGRTGSGPSARPLR